MPGPPEKNKEPEDKKIVTADKHLWYRRNFLTYAGIGGLTACACASGVAAVRIGYPRVLFEPPTQFKAGSPDDYSMGEVNTKWIPSYRVWIVREKEGFYALYASCTHLGCTPSWLPGEDKYKCFCHGSGFDKDGINFEGPAPRPLERVKIGLSEDSQLLVDTRFRFRYERGEWEKDDAYLKL